MGNLLNFILNILRVRSLLFILFLLPGFYTFGQIVQGRIVDGKKDKSISFGLITLSGFDKKKLVELSDVNGLFRFPCVEPGDYLITFSSIGYADTTFNKITVKTDTAILLIYSNYCQYDLSLKNKKCPACHKKNTVIPIIYGLPYSKDGRDPTKGNGRKFILAGCEISYCDPHWYCKRDKISF